jgi:hypothetical protein
MTTLWRYRGATPSPEQFVQTLWQEVLAMFTVVRVRTQEPVGLVVAYRADFRNGFVTMAQIMKDVPDRSIVGHDSFLLFVNYIFKCWPIRKIYGETSERNWDRFGNGHNLAFVEEGRLRSHEYFDGRYWDMILVALYREQYEARAEKVLPRILPSSSPSLRSQR